MTTEQPIDLKQALGLVWGKLMMERSYQNALMAALLGHVIAQEKGDDGLKNNSLGMITKAAEELKAQAEPQPHTVAAAPACAFCGKAQPEVRLAAGPNVFICDGCVATLSEAFSEPTKNQ